MTLTLIYTYIDVNITTTTAFLNGVRFKVRMLCARYNGNSFNRAVITSAAQLGFRAVSDARSGVSYPETVVNFKITR